MRARQQRQETPYENIVDKALDKCKEEKEIDVKTEATRDLDVRSAQQGQWRVN